MISFSKQADITQVEECLDLSLTATEALIGKETLNNHATFSFSKEKRRFDLTVSGPAGDGLLRCFVNILSDEIGREYFTVRCGDEGGNDPKKTDAEPSLGLLAVLVFVLV